MKTKKQKNNMGLFHDIFEQKDREMDLSSTTFSHKRKSSAGFSKVEILIFVGVIGLLGAISMAMLGSFEKRTRDAERLADVRQIQAGLEMYYTQGASFSGACSAEVERGGVRTTDCQDNAFIDWSLYSDPLWESAGACGSAEQQECAYGIEITNKDEYYIFFYLEKGTDEIGEGLHFVSRNGLDR